MQNEYIDLIDDIFGKGTNQHLSNRLIGTDYLNELALTNELKIADFIESLRTLSTAIFDFFDTNKEFNSTYISNINTLTKWTVKFNSISQSREIFYEKVSAHLSAGDIQSTICPDYDLAVELIPDVLKSINTNCFNQLPAKYVISEYYNKDWLLFI